MTRFRFSSSEPCHIAEMPLHSQLMAALYNHQHFLATRKFIRHGCQVSRPLPSLCHHIPDNFVDKHTQECGWRCLNSNACFCLCVWRWHLWHDLKRSLTSPQRPVNDFTRIVLQQPKSKSGSSGSCAFELVHHVFLRHSAVNLVPEIVMY